MSIISVVIPFRDEEEIISETHHQIRWLRGKNYEIIWVNDGSRDDSERILRALLEDTEQLISTEGLGILGAFLAGSKTASRSVLLWLPADCVLTENLTEESVNQMEAGNSWGAFEKTYDNSLLAFYAYLQNRFLLRSGVVAWTNVFVFPKTWLEGIKASHQFPADLNLSKELNSKLPLKILPGRVQVSSRKYKADGFLKRIFQNAIVLGLYLTGLKGKRLEGIYQSSLWSRRVLKGAFYSALVLLCFKLYASTTQKRSPPRQQPSSSSRPKGSGSEAPSSSISYSPVQKSAKDASDWIYELPRKGVSIHEIDVRGEKIQIKGAYTDDTSLEAFSKLLTHDGKREIDVKKKVYYRMGTKKDYEIILENEW